MNISFIDSLMARLETYNWKIFVTGFLAGFIGIALSNAGVKLPHIASPLGSGNTEKVNIMKEVKPLLHKKENTFSVKKPSSLIAQSYADADIDLGAYVVIDGETGELLGGKSVEKKQPIASLTKIMTAVVALDLAKRDEVFTVSRRAARQIPTKIGVKPGQKLSLEELLNAALLTSANDAVEVIREGINKKYGEDIFVEAMNEKASFLKLTNSHFENPQGFDDAKNYSSSEDLAVLASYTLTNYPLIEEIVKKDYEFLPENSNHTQFDLYNWNGLIGVYPGATGFKIGYTEDAGRTSLVVAEREGKKMIAVVLGAERIIDRDMWAGQLLDIGYEAEYTLPRIDVSESDLQAKYASWQYWN